VRKVEKSVAALADELEVLVTDARDRIYPTRAAS
jgi:hypothetical protein